jgi:hypothetical protein
LFAESRRRIPEEEELKNTRIRIPEEREFQNTRKRIAEEELQRSRVSELFQIFIRTLNSMQLNSTIQCIRIIPPV